MELSICRFIWQFVCKIYYKCMATWVTHLIIVDRVLERIPNLCRHEFCVGNIAPDCNVEKERMRDIYTFEREYLDNHPNSGYLTELMGYILQTIQFVSDYKRFLVDFESGKDYHNGVRK